MQLRSARGRLLWFMVLLLVLPLANKELHFINSGELHGVGNSAKPGFSWRSWWDGTYQPDMDKYCNDAIGFRPDMIRTVNQLNYTFFNKTNTGNVILGKRHDLLFWDYIEAFRGLNYHGDQYPVASLYKMKKIQDTLEKLGKGFVMVHAGSKISYFADDIPDWMPTNPTGKNDLRNYVRVADSLGINQIDFNSWLVSMRGKWPHHPYNRQGIHWNMYGGYYVIDSLTRYMERAKHIRMMRPEIVKIDRSHKARMNEDDVEAILNVIFPTDTTEYWYPEIRYRDTAGAARPKVIYIGDSFVWTLINDGIFGQDTDPEYWHYCRTAVFKDYHNEAGYKTLDNFDWKASLDKADYIVLIYTATQLVLSSDEFVNRFYNYYYPGK